MRIAVTGAGGFVGYAVATALLERGHDVVALVRRRASAPVGAELRSLDVRDTGAVLDALGDVDGVCHLASLGRVRDSREDPLGYWRTNLGGTLNVLAAAAEVPRLHRVVLASTASVYSTGADQPLTEDAPRDPGHPYGASKLAGDLAARGVAETGTVGAVSLRAFNVVGAWRGRYDSDETRLIPKALAVARGDVGELVMNGDGTAVRDFVHVRDMADAFLRGLDTCEPGRWTAYNIGSGHATRVVDVISAAERITGRTVPVRHRDPVPEPSELLADSTRAREQLGWKPEHSTLDRIIGDAWNALNCGYAPREYSGSD